MKKLLRFFTRKNEEFFFGIFLLVGMFGAALSAMEVLHHPIHLELDHVRMEEDFRSMPERCDKGSRQRAADEGDQRFYEEMKQKRTEHEQFMQESERRRKHFEESEKWIEEYDRKLRQSKE